MQVVLAGKASDSMILSMLQQQHDSVHAAVFEANATGQKVHVPTTAALPP